MNWGVRHWMTSSNEENAMTDNKPVWLTVDEVAAREGVSKMTVYRMIEDKETNGLRVRRLGPGGKRRFYVELSSLPAKKEGNND